MNQYLLVLLGHYRVTAHAMQIYWCVYTVIYRVRTEFYWVMSGTTTNGVARAMPIYWVRLLGQRLHFTGSWRFQCDLQGYLHGHDFILQGQSFVPSFWGDGTIL